MALPFYMLLMQIRSVVYLSPTSTYRPLADWRSSAIVLAGVSSMATGVPDVFSRENFTPPGEIYASCGGLLVALINAPHLLMTIVIIIIIIVSECLIVNT